ncbi:PEP-CTERM sorting domain-containing protein [Colwellia sp. E2M01]|uniref:PEP-CTERM sorting domain-containing protein n=1 Tax=Colwellia sp. E2M01 TaxID=2841561 RepID=UPI001C09715E|nr:PEP-CTERM sorting domain-containing protein [Colwellia sp. E2M01]MBU2869507.1 PEP-CTERM sorting domain-containing protein [Colwellia sp. E2M01]
MNIKLFIKTLTLITSLFIMKVQATPITYDGIEFSEGAVSFADVIVDYTEGTGVSDAHNNPLGAIGAPDLGSNDTWVALGGAGSLTVQFTDNSLTTSGDASLDLWVFEIGNAIEPANVDISTDGFSWFSVGTVGGATDGIDIDAFIGSGVILDELYSFVRLTDLNGGLSGFPYAGADIDAIGAITSAEADPDLIVSVPEPSTLAIFALGIFGLASRRFKK